MGVMLTMHLHSLTDDNTPLVADTSVIINLVASGIPEQILSAINNPIYIVDEIIPELDRGSKKGCSDADVLTKLISDGIVTCVSLNEEGWEHFEQLVCGSAKTSLDDGEAATLAYCAVHKAVPIIDERKANKVCKEQYSLLKPISSASLFKLANKNRGIIEDHLSEALHRALTDGRMRVLEPYIDWVINLVGASKAANCNSLPQSRRNLAMASVPPLKIKVLKSRISS